MARTDAEMTLPDGRKLCWAEYGDPDGLPVFYFHGCPSSRLEPEMFGAELSSAHLRIIAPDRPGIGLSDWQASRTFKDWTKDILQLADHLGWSHFSLLGNSGGGPYVIACAALISERVIAAVVVSGAWRMDALEVKANLRFMNRIFWAVARYFPPALRLMLMAMGKSDSSAKSNSTTTADVPSEGELKGLSAMYPPPDVAALAAPGRLKALSRALTEALRPGTKGAAWDARMYVHRFDFDHTGIRVPVRAYHGGLDRNVPLALVKKYLAEIPGATLTIWPEDGHLSAPCNHVGMIVEALSDVRSRD
jgi:pimeloyl-ACP methyl ester carboxylesterase